MPLFPLYGPVPPQGPVAAPNLGFPATGGAATTPGAPPTGYSPAYGGVPQVPSLIDIYGQATGANQALAGPLTKLGGQITTASEQELLNNLRMAIPGYDASVAASMGNIGQLQHGQVPSDVRNQITQEAAERGIATGLYDSPNANAALLRSLGLTSLGLEGEGEKQMSALVGRTPQAQPFDISKLMLSPTDLYESNLLANIYRAAPVPKAAADQLLSDQLGFYNIGRRNVPSYSSGMPTPGSPYSPLARDVVSPTPLGPYSLPSGTPSREDWLRSIGFQGDPSMIDWSDVGAPETEPPPDVSAYDDSFLSDIYGG